VREAADVVARDRRMQQVVNFKEEVCQGLKVRIALRLVREDGTGQPFCAAIVVS
jgi:hypothetical protein